MILYSFFFLIAFLVLAIFVERSLDVRRLRHDLLELQISLQAARADTDGLRARLALRDDPKTIEDLARERLALVRPGEEKVIFVGE